MDQAVLLSKYELLKSILQSYDSVIVAFSGGIDSTLLCYAAQEVFKEKFIAVTANSDIYQQEELRLAQLIAQKYSWKHLIINSNELSQEQFILNNPDRCKWCKSIRLSFIQNLANELGIKTIISGDNVDDLSDYRPGYEYSSQMGVKSPLIEAHLTKSDIRALAKLFQLPNYSKPASPCLASRIPYGQKITSETLKQVEKAEKVLKNLGYSIVRVRHHNDLARIELEVAEIPNFIACHADIVSKALKNIGYKYVTLDLNGYRMGSLNEGIIKNNE